MLRAKIQTSAVSDNFASRFSVLLLFNYPSIRFRFGQAYMLTVKVGESDSKRRRDSFRTRTASQKSGSFCFPRYLIRQSFPTILSLFPCYSRFYFSCVLLIFMN